MSACSAPLSLTLPRPTPAPTLAACRLAADPIAARGLRVKAGVLDGFIRASSVGPVA